jgi:hypothetical protein
MNLPPLFHRLAISLALIIMFGVLVHDTKFDKAFKLAVPAAAAAAVAAHALDIAGGHAHTHVERVSVSSAFAASPSMQPRDDHRRYYLSKKTTRTDDFFGGSHIMWPSF